jgi:hypothetical protein
VARGVRMTTVLKNNTSIRCRVCWGPRRHASAHRMSESSGPLLNSVGNAIAQSVGAPRTRLPLRSSCHPSPSLQHLTQPADFGPHIWAPPRKRRLAHGKTWTMTRAEPDADTSRTRAAAVMQREHPLQTEKSSRLESKSCSAVYCRTRPKRGEERSRCNRQQEQGECAMFLSREVPQRFSIFCKAR